MLVCWSVGPLVSAVQTHCSFVAPDQAREADLGGAGRPFALSLFLFSAALALHFGPRQRRQRIVIGCPQFGRDNQEHWDVIACLAALLPYVFEVDTLQPAKDFFQAVCREVRDVREMHEMHSKDGLLLPVVPCTDEPDVPTHIPMLSFSTSTREKDKSCPELLCKGLTQTYATSVLLSFLQFVAEKASRSSGPICSRGVRVGRSLPQKHYAFQSFCGPDGNAA